MRAFDYDAWARELLRLVGRGAEAMINLEKTEKKYDVQKHAQRLARITAHWDELTSIMANELPPEAEVKALLTSVGAPVTPREAGLEDNVRETFPVTKDIRDKYILSRLLWDLGLLDEIRPE